MPVIPANLCADCCMNPNPMGAYSLLIFLNIYQWIGSQINSSSPGQMTTILLTTQSLQKLLGFYQTEDEFGLIFLILNMII